MKLKKPEIRPQKDGDGKVKRTGPEFSEMKRN